MTANEARKPLGERATIRRKIGALSTHDPQFTGTRLSETTCRKASNAHSEDGPPGKCRRWALKSSSRSDGGATPVGKGFRWRALGLWGRRTAAANLPDPYWAVTLVSLEKIVEISFAAGGKVAATATVMKPASKAYSTKSWPHSSRQILALTRYLNTKFLITSPPNRWLIIAGNPNLLQSDNGNSLAFTEDIRPNPVQSWPRVTSGPRSRGPGETR